jgi:RNA recognition motif-containing protein
MGTRLFVDGIPVSFTDLQLKDLFIRYGTVLSAEIVRNPRVVSLRFGYVEMAMRHEANMAVRQLNRLQLCGVSLVVRIANSGTSGPTQSM